jgi:alkylation response protein AidB-like acyl-CoA dehydrogenase
MSLARTDEQRLLGDNLRRYLREANEFEARRKRLSADVPDRLALWSGLCDMGVLGAAFDEAAGGFAGDARSVAVVMAEIGRGLVIEPVLGCGVIAGRVLRHAGDAEGIACLIAGEQIVALAHDAGRDPFGPPLLHASRRNGRVVLDGRVRAVRHADVAQEFLVTVILDGECAVVRVPRERIAVEAYRLMDAAGAGDLLLKEVEVDEAACLRFSLPAELVIRDALEWGVLGVVAEISGLVEAANGATAQYLMTRKQFGVPIGTFQALQHRAADMKIAEEEIGSILQLLIQSFGGEPSTQRSALVSAAKVVADSAGRKVGHEAIQMHGGMGVSDELDISHFGRRLATIRAELGSADTHRLHFGPEQELNELLLLQESEDAQAWRAQVREFTRKHLPDAMRHKLEQGLKTEKEDFVGWQKILSQHGMFAGAWPREHGGQGWNLVQQLIFAQEATLNSAPQVSPYGVNMVGPVIFNYGNEAQRRQHLPGILSSDVWWCQGYSEPGSGSDLASLKTFAERDGDHYVINGSKLWTTEAHWADWMHCLVRTDRSGKPQTGITFLLIDMRTPGISIKPIVTIDGIHHTNATFFDNVRVPVANRVGEEGQGWGIAKFLLGNERVSIADTGPKLRLIGEVRRLQATVMADASVSAAAKALLAAKSADVSIQLMTLCAMERQYVEAWNAGAKVGAEASILKIRGTEILQAITELALELEGALGAAYDPRDLYRNPQEAGGAVKHASTLAYEYLYARCWSIFGGTNEVQRNLIAKQVLGV